MKKEVLETKKFKTVKTLRDIENDPRVADIHKEEGQWWGLLVDGYEWCPEAQIFREKTIKEMCYVLNELVYEKDTEEMRTVSSFQEFEDFKRTDLKDSWSWDFKYNGHTVYLYAEKGDHGCEIEKNGEMVTKIEWCTNFVYCGMTLQSYYSTRKWESWEERFDHLRRCLDDEQVPKEDTAQQKAKKKVKKVKDKISGLNESERKVLKCLADVAADVAGGDFGYTDDVVQMVDVLDMSRSQIKGYISSILKKEIIAIDEERDGQYIFTDKGWKVLTELGKDYLMF